jgi:hypothetical protein
MLSRLDILQELVSLEHDNTRASYNIKVKCITEGIEGISKGEKF